jgi:hypothetical protein
VKHVRALGPDDRAAMQKLLTGHAAAELVARDAVEHAALGLFDDDGLTAMMVHAPVPLAHGAHEIRWLVGAGLDELPPLLSALRELAPEAALVRFVGGNVHRGDLPPHVLDAAGLERRGRIPSFFGPDDDLLVYSVTLASSTAFAFDPTNPAHLQDAAFGYRDFAAERDFLLACARAHGGRPVRRVASWACGSGRHLGSFAEIGVDGVGIEDDLEQLELAATLYADARARAEWIASPIDAPVKAEPVDLSFIMLSAVHRLATEGAIIDHLQSAAALLGDGGVHVIEATHPSDLDPAHAKIVAWTEMRPPYSVHSRFRLDIERRARDGTVPALLDVRCRDQSTGANAGALQQQERWLVPDTDNWEKLVERAGNFAIAAMLGDFQLEVASNQAGAWRTLMVLRKI